MSIIVKKGAEAPFDINKFSSNRVFTLWGSGFDLADSEIASIITNQHLFDFDSLVKLCYNVDDENDVIRLVNTKIQKSLMPKENGKFILGCDGYIGFSHDSVSVVKPCGSITFNREE